MLVALDRAGVRTVADAALPRDERRACPVCGEDVLLKAGRKVIAHFAHRAGSTCVAGGEGLHHLAAKRLLHDAFAAQGLESELEARLGPARRADLLVRAPSGRTVAVEVQDSPIAVADMKAREREDRRAGAHTCWIFTERRVPEHVWDPPPWPARLVEARLPDEMLWRWHLTRLPVPCLRVDRGALFGLELSPIIRATGCRRLRTTVNVVAIPLSFTPLVRRSARYGDPVATFAAPQ